MLYAAFSGGQCRLHALVGHPLPTVRAIRAANRIYFTCISYLRPARSAQRCRGWKLQCRSICIHQASEKAHEGPKQPVEPSDFSTKTVKRKVALFVGYVGTGFRGLQFQRDLGEGERSIEHALEQAIYKAGLLLGTNVGQSHRTGWSRSSRTDAGVHSLSTVTALKMEVQDGHFEHDREGQELAKAINLNLPDEVRVFSVQRTHNAFNARQHCRDRTYHYYLPASALGLSLNGGAEDARILDRLQECLALYRGSHAFHNHTVRQRYRREARGKVEAKAKALWEKKNRNAERAAAKLGDNVADSTAQSAAAEEAGKEVGREAPERACAELRGDAANSGVSPADAAGNEGGGEAAPGQEAGWEAAPIQENGGASESDQAGEVFQEGKAEEKGSRVAVVREGLRPLRFWWKHEADANDSLSQAHYRHIIEATASEPFRLTPDGQHCIRISLRGSSFMVYQIRHTVAMATLAALGRVPLLFVEAIMCPNARALLPLSPPGVLVLADSSFYNFPAVGKEPHPVTRISGPALCLRDAGSMSRHHFSKQVLHPALSNLLEEEECREWCRQIQAVHPDAEAMTSFLAEYSAWKVKRDQTRKEQQALREAQKLEILGSEAL